MTDLFGERIPEPGCLRQEFCEPPFSVLDTKTGLWQARKQKWRALGIRSELGRDCVTFNLDKSTSIFDPALCEVLYRWFTEEGDSVLDPFAGGSVRGIVAESLGRRYTGIDIRPEQIASNREQADAIFGKGLGPRWVCGDSDKVLDGMGGGYDFVFSCPPYADLEVYSDLTGDISNMDWADFKAAYASIIAKACSKLKPGALACFVVGEVRGKNGGFLGLVPFTVWAFRKCGMLYYNEAVLLNAVNSASMRAKGNMKSKKLVKIHQNILVFKKEA